MKRALFIATALALITVLAVAGCGGSSNGGAYGSGNRSTSATTSSDAQGDANAAVVAAAVTPKLGRIVVDSNGFTLYDFHKDKGTTSACYGACAQVWPPLVTDGAPKASPGANASKLGTTMRKDGTTQVTYAGHPLYTYAADTKPGDIKGNDIDSFGAEWYALQPSGEEVEG